MELVYFNGPQWIDIWPVFAVKIMGHTKSLVSWARKLHYTRNFKSVQIIIPQQRPLKFTSQPGQPNQPTGLLWLCNSYGALLKDIFFN